MGYDKRLLGNLDEGVVANALRLVAEHHAAGGVTPHDETSRRELSHAKGVARTIERRSKPSVTAPNGRIWTHDDSREMMPPDIAAKFGYAPRPARAYGGSIVDDALSIVNQHLARGGMAGGLGVVAPYAGAAPAAVSVPVLPNLTHNYVKHGSKMRARFGNGGEALHPDVERALSIAAALRGRPRFDDGGDPGGGGDDGSGDSYGGFDGGKGNEVSYSGGGPGTGSGGIGNGPGNGSGNVSGGGVSGIGGGTSSGDNYGRGSSGPTGNGGGIGGIGGGSSSGDNYGRGSNDNPGGNGGGIGGIGGGSSAGDNYGRGSNDSPSGNGGGIGGIGGGSSSGDNYGRGSDSPNGGGVGGIGGGSSSGDNYSGNGPGTGSGDSWGNSGLGFGSIGDSDTTFGRGLGQLGQLGSYNGSENLGFGSFGNSVPGSSPSGYTSAGGYNLGSIGPSGIGTGDGTSGFGIGGSGTAGFGNFSNDALGSNLGVLGSVGNGLNGVTGGFAGLGAGSDNPSANLTSALGFHQTGMGLGYDGSLGKFGSADPKSGTFGDLSGVGFGQAAASGFGTFGLNGLRAATPTTLAGATTPSGPFGGLPGSDAFNNVASPQEAAAYAAYAKTLGGTLTAPVTSVTSSPLGPATTTPSVDAAWAGSMPTNYDFAQASPVDAALATAYAARFGQLGTPTGDPTTVGDAPALTVHTPGFGGLGFGLSGLDGPTTNFNNPVSIGYSPTLSTKTAPGFDNFGLSSQAMTKSLGIDGPVTKTSDGLMNALGQNYTSIGGYTPPGWTQQGAIDDIAKSPADYDQDGKYPGLSKYTGFQSLSPGFAKGFFGNGQAEAGPGLPTNAINATGGDLGLSQWTGERKAGLLSDLGLSGLTNDELKSSLTPDTLADQALYGLNEIATQKRFANVLSAAQNQNLSPQQEAYQIAKTYEAPPGITNDPTSLAARNELQRRENYAANFGNDAATTSGYNAPSYSLGTANSVIGNPSGTTTDAAPTAPTTTTAQDVQNALAIARSENMSPINGSPASGYPGQWSDNAQFDPAVHSGEDSMTPEALAAEQAKWQHFSTALTDAAALDAQIAAARQAVPTSTPSPSLTVSPSFTPSTPFGREAGAFDGKKGNEVSGYTDVPSPVTDTPAVKTEPSYLPGQQTILSGAIDAAAGVALPPVGIMNLLSKVFGGPTLGGYITSHSQPGSVSQAGGAAGRDYQFQFGDGQQLPTRTYGNDARGVNTQAPGATAPATLAGNTVAQNAYLTALAHMSSVAPTARSSNAVPLIPPNVAQASTYDPMLDPLVVAALRQSRASGGSVFGFSAPQTTAPQGTMGAGSNWQTSFGSPQAPIPAQSAFASPTFSPMGTLTGSEGNFGPLQQPLTQPQGTTGNAINPFSFEYQNAGGSTAPLIDNGAVGVPATTTAASPNTQAAYQYHAAPAPRPMTATPLVAPTALQAQFYDPMADPRVLAALRHAGVI